MSTQTRSMEILARPIADSRGDATVEVELRLAGITAVASAPAGKTLGGDEARTVPVERALANVQEILAPAVRAFDVALATSFTAGGWAGPRTWDSWPGAWCWRPPT